jgi:glyoxylase-like metal-dependent hydrolase (beta-lactamase superfamily II)
MIRDRYGRFSVRDDLPFDEAAQERARDRAGAPFRADAAPDEQIELGGRTIAFVPTAGHSAGHTAAWLHDAGVLAAGDGVMGSGIPKVDGTLLIPPMYAPPAVYLDTIERVRGLAPATLVTGHDPVLDGARVGPFLDASARAVARLATLVEGSLSEAPRTLLELCRSVHEAYGGLPPDRVADLALTVHGHLGELVDGGAAIRLEGAPTRYRSAA